MSDDPLFSKYELYKVIENRKALARKAAKETTQEVFEVSTIQDLTESICSQFKFVVPTIDKEGITVSKREVDLQQRYSRRYDWMDNTVSSVRGTAVDVRLPFEGDKEFFDIRPNTITGTPRGQVRDGKLKFSIIGQVLESENVRKQIEDTLSSIEQHLSWLRDGLVGFEEALERDVMAALEQRSNKLKSDDKMLSELGYRLEGEN